MERGGVTSNRARAYRSGNPAGRGGLNPGRSLSFARTPALMHPDAPSPDRPDDAPPAGHPDPERDKDGTESLSSPESDDKRVAEEGSAYAGRMMDDDLKTNPRVEEPGAGTEEDE